MIDTDLVGRVERMPLSKRNALWPLFEAVSNSIDAIAARPSKAKRGQITVRLVRDTATRQLPLSAENIEPITTIEVSDDGVGFTDENMVAFENLDTRYKIESGGKGVGRLTWLKVFDSITVNSIYRGRDSYRNRTFTFSLPSGVENISDVALPTESALQLRTTITLSQSKTPYHDAMRYRTEKVSTDVVRHFLYYLLDPSAPNIKIIDGDKQVTVQTTNVIQEESREFTIKDHAFGIQHLKVRSTEKSQHSVFYCANHRPVREERLTNLPDRRFEDGQEGFFYQGYVSSPYLDTRVNEQRTGVYLEEDPDLFDISQEQLYEQVEALVESFLEPELDALREETEKRIEGVIERSVPELGYVRQFNRDELGKKVTFNSTEAEVRQVLGDIHLQNQKTGRDLMKELVERLKTSVSLDLNAFEGNFEESIKKITAPAQASLASYLLYRRSIIELYRELLSKAGDVFEKEAAIHNLLFPMGKELDTAKAFINHNLWLLDERLTFANYIASDLRLNKHGILFGVDSRREPDIVCYFNLGFSEDDPAMGDLRDVIIVELKRPGPVSARKETPWEQTRTYIEEIRTGFYAKESGKKIKATDNTRFYCFIICDTDDSRIQTMIDRDQFRAIYGGYDGYFLYHEPYKAYVELIPFSKILRDADRKHRAFFDRIGLIPS